jgi:tryptophan 7-halogenase
MNDDDARMELVAAEPGAQLDPAVARLSSGRRASVWEHNCVAIGPAAVELEPLAGVELHAAQLGVSTFIELFPLDDIGAVERIEYNRLMVERFDALRDFTLAHYLVGAPRAGDFWQAVRSTRPPDRLANKLDLFRAGGRIELLDFETFEETDWAWLLLGAGCRPDSLEQSVALALERTDAPEFAALRAQLRSLANSMPPHMEYVRRLAELARRGAR